MDTHGADTRVTATADILSDNPDAAPGDIDPNEHLKNLTGAWLSWQGDDHLQEQGSLGRNFDIEESQASSNIDALVHDGSEYFDGRLRTGIGYPITPDYNSKLVTHDGESGKFLEWLVSSYDKDTHSASNPPILTAGANKVPLLAEGSLGAGSGLEVHVTPTSITKDGNEIGQMAYWITGENSKVKLGDIGAPNSLVDWNRRASTFGGYEKVSFGFEETDNVESAISVKSFDLASSAAAVVGIDPLSKRSYFDLTANADGLLTNTATGGWRKDMSMMVEQWDEDILFRNNSSSTDISDSLPFWRPFPGQDFLYTIPTTSNLTYAEVGESIYPFGPFDASAQEIPGSMSWAYLKDWATLYKDPNINSGIGGRFFSKKGTPAQRDKVSLGPIVARISFVVGFISEETATDVYQLRLTVEPAVSLWNPYSVPISMDKDISVYMDASSTPLRLEFEVVTPADTAAGTAEQTTPHSFAINDKTLQFRRANGTFRNWLVNGKFRQLLIRTFKSDPLNSVSNPEIWEPGEVRNFSPSFDANEAGFVLYPGLRYGGTKDTTAIRGNIQTGLKPDSEIKNLKMFTDEQISDRFGVGMHIQLGEQNFTPGATNFAVIQTSFHPSKVPLYTVGEVDLASVPTNSFKMTELNDATLPHGYPKL